MEVRGMIGAVAGDIIGSSHEFGRPVSGRFRLLGSSSTFTDDSALSVAVADWLLHRNTVSVEESLLKWGREYPNAGYGRGFRAFLKSGVHPEVGSTHNGSAMRVSPVGFLAETLDEALSLARESALPSHDSPDAVAGAQAVAAAVWMALHGSSKDDIREYLQRQFGYDLTMPYGEVRDEYHRLIAAPDRESHERLLRAETTVPSSMTAFLEASNYEETVRLAVMLGADTDTQACIAGAVAAAYWGVPEELIRDCLVYIPEDMLEVINACDGTRWKRERVTPPCTKRWRKEDVVVFGCDAEGKRGEQGFHSTHISRFNHYPNTGYAIKTIGASLKEIALQVNTLLKEAMENPSKRYLIREIGISKAGYTVQQIAPLLLGAVQMRNILLPASFLEEINRQSI